MRGLARTGPVGRNVNASLHVPRSRRLKATGRHRDTQTEPEQYKRSRCGFLQDPGVVPLSALRAARSQFRGSPRTLMFALGQ